MASNSQPSCLNLLSAGIVVMHHSARLTDFWGTAWHSFGFVLTLQSFISELTHLCVYYICMHILQLWGNFSAPLFSNTPVLWKQSICDLWFGMCTPRSYVLHTYHFLEEWWVAFSKEHTEVQDLWDVKEEVIVEDFSKCRWRNEVILRGKYRERMEAECANSWETTLMLFSWGQANQW